MNPDQLKNLPVGEVIFNPNEHRHYKVLCSWPYLQVVPVCFVSDREARHWMFAPDVQEQRPALTDDAEPITEEWLRSVGFEPTPSGHLAVKSLAIRESECGGIWLYWESRKINLHTRRDVRDLARMMGVELK